MSKKINFNLVLNNANITNIEELRENFSIQEMLWYYDNGLLKKWLDVRELTDYLKAVNEIDSSSDKNVICGLTKIFDVTINEHTIDTELGLIHHNNRK